MAVATLSEPSRLVCVNAFLAGNVEPFMPKRAAAAFSSRPGTPSRRNMRE
jgi:hypothetical protein